jgi:hypothetical protein
MWGVKKQKFAATMATMSTAPDGTNRIELSFVSAWMGFTGRGNRVKLPSCVLDAIRGAFS